MVLPQERYVLSEIFVIVRWFSQILQAHKLNMIKREKLARHPRAIWQIWACDVTPTSRIGIGRGGHSFGPAGAFFQWIIRKALWDLLTQKSMGVEKVGSKFYIWGWARLVASIGFGISRRYTPITCCSSIALPHVHATTEHAHSIGTCDQGTSEYLTRSQLAGELCPAWSKRGV